MGLRLQQPPFPYTRSRFPFRLTPVKRIGSLKSRTDLTLVNTVPLLKNGLSSLLYFFILGDIFFYVYIYQHVIIRMLILLIQ